MTTQQVTFNGQSFSYEGLFSLPLSELCKVYNAAAPKVGGTPTKKFSDKVSGVKRTWAVLTKIEPEDVTPAPQPKAAPQPQPKVKAAGKPRGKRFVFPQGEELKKVREGTHRATLVELMSRREGATFDECLAATWGKHKDMLPEIQEKTCYEAIRLIHYYSGYGMRQTETGDRKGAIHLFFNEK